MTTAPEALVARLLAPGVIGLAVADAVHARVRGMLPSLPLADVAARYDAAEGPADPDELPVVTVAPPEPRDPLAHPSPGRPPAAPETNDRRARTFPASERPVRSERRPAGTLIAEAEIRETGAKTVIPDASRSAHRELRPAAASSAATAADGAPAVNERPPRTLSASERAVRSDRDPPAESEISDSGAKAVVSAAFRSADRALPLVAASPATGETPVGRTVPPATPAPEVNERRVRSPRTYERAVPSDNEPSIGRRGDATPIVAAARPPAPAPAGPALPLADLAATVSDLVADKLGVDKLGIDKLGADPGGPSATTCPDPVRPSAPSHRAAPAPPAPDLDRLTSAVHRRFERRLAVDAARRLR